MTTFIMLALEMAMSLQRNHPLLGNWNWRPAGAAGGVAAGAGVALVPPPLMQS